MKKKRVQIQTPYGIFAMEATDKGIRKVSFPAQVSKRRRLQVMTRYHQIPNELKKACQLLVDYFRGAPVSFQQLQFDFSGCSYFERKVLRTLARLKRGEVKSYAQLAKMAGFPGAARAVGTVMRKNRVPIFLPCHRIVRQDGALGDYSGGVRWKKRLLTLEGIIL